RRRARRRGILLGGAREGTLRHAELLRDLIRRLHRVEQLRERLRRLLLLALQLLVDALELLELLLVVLDLLLELAVLGAAARLLVPRVGQLLAQPHQLPAQPVRLALGVLGLGGRLLDAVQQLGQQREDLAAVFDPASQSLTRRRRRLFHVDRLSLLRPPDRRLVAEESSIRRPRLATMIPSPADRDGPPPGHESRIARAAPALPHGRGGTRAHAAPRRRLRPVRRPARRAPRVVSARVRRRPRLLPGPRRD